MPNIYGAETGAAAAPCDLMTEGEAKALATRIEGHWHRLGQTTVKVWAEAVDPESRPVVWVIQSNLVNGLPPARQ
ncbi:hypothetical protein [Azospirillum argentinense]|uniref:Uncharacterized protein n=1 Tax=Azospirillum brasilense TaxID=192 RepID=A0A4D8QK12_AZOBR|nr:hypothetical protein [Azospirillum argentinense]QCO07259.1 hypothetical protein D3867_35765 [Azospirillum argentinense]QCO07414.1 hypothetical protein D3867_36690 [Azospirillum argentinense]